jgi:hypothetical protein
MLPSVDLALIIGTAVLVPVRIISIGIEMFVRRHCPEGRADQETDELRSDDTIVGRNDLIRVPDGETNG